jgi:hypothetical protein
LPFFPKKIEQVTLKNSTTKELDNYPLTRWGLFFNNFVISTKEKSHTNQLNNEIYALSK